MMCKQFYELEFFIIVSAKKDSIPTGATTGVLVPTTRWLATTRHSLVICWVSGISPTVNCHWFLLH